MIATLITLWCSVFAQAGNTNAPLAASVASRLTQQAPVVPSVRSDDQAAEEAYAQYLLSVILSGNEEWRTAGQFAWQGNPLSWMDNRILSPGGVPFSRLEGNEYVARCLLDYLAANPDEAREGANYSWSTHQRVWECLMHCGEGVTPYVDRLRPYLRRNGIAGGTVGDLPFVTARSRDFTTVVSDVDDSTSDWTVRVATAAVVLLRAGVGEQKVVGELRELLNDEMLRPELSARVVVYGAPPKTPLDISELTLQELLLVCLCKYDPQAPEITAFVNRAVDTDNFFATPAMLHLLRNSKQDTARLQPLVAEQIERNGGRGRSPLRAALCESPEDIEFLRQALTKARAHGGRKAAANGIVVEAVRSVERRRQPYSNDTAHVQRLLDYGLVPDESVRLAASQIVADLINSGHPLAPTARQGVLDHLATKDETRIAFAAQVINLLVDPFEDALGGIESAWRFEPLTQKEQPLARTAMVLARMGAKANSALPLLSAEVQKAGSQIDARRPLFALYRIDKDSQPAIAAAQHTRRSWPGNTFTAFSGELILLGKEKGLTPVKLSHRNGGLWHLIEAIGELVDRRFAGEPLSPNRQVLEWTMLDTLVDPDRELIRPSVRWRRLLRDCDGSEERAIKVLSMWLGDEPELYNRSDMAAFEILAVGAESNADAFKLYIRKRSHAIASTQVLGVDRLEDVLQEDDSDSLSRHFLALVAEDEAIAALPMSPAVVPSLISRAEQLRKQLSGNQAEFAGEIAARQVEMERRQQFGTVRNWRLELDNVRLPIKTAAVELCAIVNYFACLGADAKAAVPFLNELKDQKPFGTVAITALMAIGPEAITPMAGLVADDDVAWVDGALAAIGISANPQALPDEAKALAEAVLGPSVTEAEEAIGRLSKYGPAGIHKLVDMAETAPWNRRALIVENMSSGGKSAADALARYAIDEDEDLTIRISAMHMMKIYDMHPSPDLVVAIGKLLLREDDRLRQIAMSKLFTMGRRAQPAAASFVALFKQLGSARVVYHLRLESGYLKTQPGMPRRTLESAVSFQYYVTPYAGTLRQLRYCGREAREALPHLVEVAAALHKATSNDEHAPGEWQPYVPSDRLGVQELFWAIRNVGPDADSLAPLFELLVDEEYKELAAHALGGVSLDEDLQAAAELLTQHLEHEDPLVRGYAAVLCGGVRQPNPKLQTRLLATLENPSDFVTAATAYALGALEIQEAAEALRELANDTNSSDVKLAAQTALDKINLATRHNQ